MHVFDLFDQQLHEKGQTYQYAHPFRSSSPYEVIVTFRTAWRCLVLLKVDRASYLVRLRDRAPQYSLAD
jgi:hypothetical protein